MTARVKDILETLNQEAPFTLAEAWDNVGLLVGDPEQEAKGVLVGLDATNRLVEEAIAVGANVVITHHPLIFKPLSAINTAEPDGRLLATALSHHIAIIACHTNFDAAAEGVNSILAEELGLTDHQPLIPAAQEKGFLQGLGRIGSFSKPLSATTFLNRVHKLLGLDCVFMAGKLPEKIKTVALCGGSGSDFAFEARKRGADVYLSAEIKHNVAVWAGECGFCIIDGTHYATEKPALAILIKKLEEACRRKNWNIKILATETERHPFSMSSRKNL